MGAAAGVVATVPAAIISVPRRRTLAAAVATAAPVARTLDTTSSWAAVALVVGAAGAHSQLQPTARSSEQAARSARARRHDTKATGRCRSLPLVERSAHAPARSAESRRP
eukprot:73170-Prymnesium_polylepis.1